MLLAFLLFGTLLSTLLGSVAILPVLLLALITLVVVRPVAMGIVLRRAPISRQVVGLARAGSARCCLACCWFLVAFRVQSRYWQWQEW